MKDKIIVLSTAGSADEAHKIAQALIERKHAACVNVIPAVESTYWWQGKIETSHELLLVIKTTAAAFDRVQATIKQLHSYSVPECVAINIEQGSDAYLKWIGESVAPD
jgi:periplasmic divalent cation tolerance protein